MVIHTHPTVVRLLHMGHIVPVFSTQPQVSHCRLEAVSGSSGTVAALGSKHILVNAAHALRGEAMQIDESKFVTVSNCLQRAMLRDSHGI